MPKQTDNVMIVIQDISTLKEENNAEFRLDQKMLELFLLFMAVFITPFLILFVVLALIRYFKFKPPLFSSHDQTFIPYDYYKRNGKRSIILTIIFGSYGMLYAHIGFGFLFFFINSFMYFIVFINTIFESNASPVIVLIPITRVMNIISIILFVKIRLKMVEKQFHTYIENDLYRKLNLAHFEEEKRLSESERQRIQQERYEKVKARLYEQWTKKES